MRKVYYIVRAKAGCFGATGTTQRLPERFTNYAKALAFAKSLRKDHGELIWVDWYAE